jgi:hypothetical protein
VRPDRARTGRNHHFAIAMRWAPSPSLTISAAGLNPLGKASLAEAGARKSRTICSKVHVGRDHIATLLITASVTRRDCSLSLFTGPLYEQT